MVIATGFWPLASGSSFWGEGFHHGHLGYTLLGLPIHILGQFRGAWPGPPHSTRDTAVRWETPPGA